MSGAGRFAPSPTGPLHRGSLLAALASYLDSRSRGDRWLVRIDDLDVPRSMPGAETLILKSLEEHNLHWDGAVRHQSERMDAYDAALDALATTQSLFYCRCSRRQLRGRPYPGTCRSNRSPLEDAAIRIRVDDVPVEFVDLVNGPIAEDLASSVGDFVVRRRDGIVAYQLACAIDDGDPAITRVVRGGDLLDNTPRQLLIMRKLGLPEPTYAHIPVIVDDAGRKLSKQNHAPPLDDRTPGENLHMALRQLGLTPPNDVAGSEELLAWAVSGFSLSQISRHATIQAPHGLC